MNEFSNIQLIRSTLVNTSIERKRERERGSERERERERDPFYLSDKFESAREEDKMLGDL